MPSRTNACFHSVDDPTFALRQGSRAHVGSFASSSLIVGIADHPAVFTLARNHRERRVEQLGVETIVWRAVLARYGYALDAWMMWASMSRALSQLRQPEAVTAGLEGDRDAFDPVS